MSEKTTQLRVGLFVFTGVLLALIVVSMIGSEQRFFERNVTLYSHFNTVSGLRPGAGVQLGGVRVGEIESVKFAGDLNDRRLVVGMRIQKKFQDRIRADSVAMIKTQGLLGDKYIFITLGSPDQPMIADHAFLSSQEPFAMDNMMERAEGAMNDVGQAARAFYALLADGKSGKEGDIHAAARSLRSTLEEVQYGKGLAHAVIYDRGGKKIVENMQQASGDLKTVMASIRNGEGTLGLLIRDPALYNDMQTLLGRADRNKLLRAVIRSMLSANDRQVLKAPQ